LALALAILPLPVTVIESPLRTLLVTAVGAASLTESRLLSTSEAAVALTAIASGAQKEERAAFVESTKSLPQYHFAVGRHAYSQAVLDNRIGSMAG
jgi:hypothetical protein